MKRILFLVALVAASSGAALAVQPPDLIHYQGVLRDAADRPLDGTYGMVFRLFSAPVGGDEIVVDTHDAVAVSGGLFSVAIGGASAGGTGTLSDGSGPGNYIYIPLVFADYADVYLEVQVEGEVLTPRTRVVSAPQALNSRFVNGVEVAAPGQLQLYVDANVGDDVNHSGLSLFSPKATIQAAVDRIPAILTGPVTIHIADGVYREEVRLTKRSRLLGHHEIRLQGNASDPNQVSLRSTTTGDGVGLLIFDTNTVVEGIRVSGFDTGVAGERWAVFSLAHCRIIGNTRVGVSVDQTILSLEDCVLLNTGVGLWADGLASVEAARVTISGGPVAVRSANRSDVSFECDSNVSLGPMEAERHSYIRDYGNGSYTSCVDDIFSRCQPGC